MEKKETGLSIKKMDGKTVITAPQGAVHLNEFMNSLPAGILNKGETGCGATSVVLENEENVIVCCPTRQLIINKVAQYPNERCPYKLLAVQKGVTHEDIEKYISEYGEKQPIKIMVTYDSYPRVAAIISEKLAHCKIVVDEYQEILDACIYRSAAIKKLLSELKREKNVTYLSATPIPCKFIPKELSDLPQYEIEWSNKTRVIPYRIQSKVPFALAVHMIKSHKLGNPFELSNHKVEEYFFFVNSVKAIQRIIKAAKLAPNEVKIICGDNEVNHLRLQGYAIENATGENKVFNFCTKTVFYGADFHSKAGLAIIISDGWVKSSLLDISTDIVQIAGRIRSSENPFKNIILHIHSAEIMCTSKIEFEEEMKAKLEYAQKTIESFNSLPDNLRCCITARIRADAPDELAYYNEESNCVEIDELKVAHMRYKFDVIDSVYDNNISIEEAYAKADYNIEDAKVWTKNPRNCIFLGGKGNQFEEFYDIYSKERKKTPIGRTDLAKDIELQHPIVQQAYDLLEEKLVRKHSSDTKKIRDLIHFHLPETQAAFKSELKNRFKEGERYSFKEAKKMLQSCYEKLRIGLNAKTTILSNYFKLKTGKTRDRLDGFLIEGRLFFLHHLR